MIENWQPIETAPKDGTRIMLWDRAPYFARWSEHCEFGQFETRPGWQGFECEDGFYSWAIETPTHWQPAPAGPDLQKEHSEVPK